MNYINQLTFLRFLAALTVLVFHFAPYQIINVAPLAITLVSFFFFLSGVVLAFNYFHIKDLSFKEFMQRRIARIYPVYLLALILTLLFSMLLKDSYPKGLSIILQIFAIQAWIPGQATGVNFPGWSISVEFFFYSLFPIIAVYFRKLSFTKMTLITLILWILSLVIHVNLTLSDLYVAGTNFHQFVLYFPIWHLNTFLFGLICGVYLRGVLTNKSISIPLARFLYVSGVLIFILLLAIKHVMGAFVSNGLFSPVFFMIIIGFSVDKSIITRIFGHKFFVLLGNSSYSLYIFQWPFYILFTYIIGQEKLDLTNFYIYAVLLTIISVLTYLFFERNVQKILLKKWIKN